MNEDEMTEERRGFLKCMAWAGTGALFSVAGGLPTSFGLDQALAATPKRLGASSFNFLQLSDSHIGFAKPANPDARATFREAVAKVIALPQKPDFVIHTGDITQLSRDQEFDDANEIMKEMGIEVFDVPGEHDMLDPEGGKAYRDRFGRGKTPGGWFSFDHKGVHFVGLVNVADLKPGGMGNLGKAQIDWLQKDLAGHGSSTPIVVFAHIPLWTVYKEWGWGTDDGAQALKLLARFGSVTSSPFSSSPKWHRHAPGRQAARRVSADFPLTPDLPVGQRKLDLGGRVRNHEMPEHLDVVLRLDRVAPARRPQRLLQPVAEVRVAEHPLDAVFGDGEPRLGFLVHVSSGRFQGLQCAQCPGSAAGVLTCRSSRRPQPAQPRISARTRPVGVPQSRHGRPIGLSMTA